MCADESGILIKGAIHKNIQKCDQTKKTKISFFKSASLFSEHSARRVCLQTFFCVSSSVARFVQGKNFKCKVNQFVLNAGSFTSSAPPLAPPLYLHAV